MRRSVLEDGPREASIIYPGMMVRDDIRVSESFEQSDFTKHSNEIRFAGPHSYLLDSIRPFSIRLANTARLTKHGSTDNVSGQVDTSLRPHP